MKITFGIDYLNERASERKLVEAEDLFQALSGTGLSHKQLNEVCPTFKTTNGMSANVLAAMLACESQPLILSRTFTGRGRGLTIPGNQPVLDRAREKGGRSLLAHLCWQAHDGVFASPPKIAYPQTQIDSCAIPEVPALEKQRFYLIAHSKQPNRATTSAPAWIGRDDVFTVTKARLGVCPRDQRLVDFFRAPEIR